MVIFIIIIMKLIIILKYKVLYIKKLILLYKFLYSIIPSILFTENNGGNGIPLIPLIIIDKINETIYYIIPIPISFNILVYLLF